ncbi:MAG: hypothetical protein Q9197_005194 [Variospora fuerteventurae]
MSEDQELLARIGHLAGMRLMRIYSTLLITTQGISIFTELNRPPLKTVIPKRQGATQLDRIPLEVIQIGELHAMHLMADEEEELRDDIPPQRKQAIEGSKQRKILLNDQRERKRMQQYLEALDAGQGSAIVQTPQTTSNTIHHIQINGLTFQILKNGSKLARKFGESSSFKR